MKAMISLFIFISILVGGVIYYTSSVEAIQRVETLNVSKTNIEVINSVTLKNGEIIKISPIKLETAYKAVDSKEPLKAQVVNFGKEVHLFNFDNIDLTIDIIK